MITVKLSKVKRLTNFFKKILKNNKKIRKSSVTVHRDKIELVRLSSVRKFIKVR